MRRRPAPAADIAADGALRFVGSEAADAGTIWFER
jgi:hypothetical protein